MLVSWFILQINFQIEELAICHNAENRLNKYRNVRLAYSILCPRKMFSFNESRVIDLYKPSGIRTRDLYESTETDHWTQEKLKLK